MACNLHNFTFGSCSSLKKILNFTFWCYHINFVNVIVWVNRLGFRKLDTNCTDKVFRFWTVFFVSFSIYMFSETVPIIHMY